MDDRKQQQEKKKPNSNGNGKLNKERTQKEFEFCKVCNLNHDLGRRHNYYPNHAKSLSSLLFRFRKKLADVRFFLKHPTFLRPEHASLNQLWCIFCDLGIEELNSSFACRNAITHLASLEHLKNLKNFLWKYGGGMDQNDSFRVSEEDLVKWDNRCKSLKSEAAPIGEGSYGLCFGPSKDIHNELNSDKMGYSEKISVHSFNSSLSNGVLPLQCFTDERYQVSLPEVSAVANVGPLPHGTSSFSVERHGNMDFQAMHARETTKKDLTVNRDIQHTLTGHSREGLVYCFSRNNGVKRMVDGESSNQLLHNFTDVSSGLPGGPKVNVHSEAPPPWFEENEESQLNVHVKKELLVNGLFSHLHKSGNSQKLNPKRVGAAWAEKRKIQMEMEKKGEIISNTFDADWLPNFGRVWQSGSRKESKKEFKMEKQKLVKAENQSETMKNIHPYISKRMRRDVGEKEDVIDGHVNGTEKIL